MAEKKTRTTPTRRPAARASGRRATDVVQGAWSSGFVFVLAVTGAAIGLNSFWQFPYLAVHNGGGLFLLVFLLALLLISVPVLMAETVVGRLAGTLPTIAIRRLIGQRQCGPRWAGLGIAVTLTGFLIFSYLCVIGGWTWAYAVRAATGVLDGRTLGGTLSEFFSFSGDPERQLFWHAAFLFATAHVVGRGVNRGVEPAVRYGVPAMLAGIAVLTVYALVAGSAAHAVSALFLMRPELFTYRSVLIAIAEAIFCSGIGVGAVMAYGSYLKPGVSIGGSSVAIAALVAVVTVLVSLFVLSVLMAVGQKPVSGPSLLFEVLPYALMRLNGGAVADTLLYLTLGAAAWFSAIALVEAPIGWVRSRTALDQPRAAALVVAAAWIVGVVVILSFNYWAFPFRLFGANKQLGVFDIIQALSADALIPLGIVAVALFASWGLNRVAVHNELDVRWPFLFRVWLYVSRGLVPLTLFVLLFYLPGLFQ